MSTADQFTSFSNMFDIFYEFYTANNNISNFGWKSSRWRDDFSYWDICNVFQMTQNFQGQNRANAAVAVFNRLKTNHET